MRFSEFTNEWHPIILESIITEIDNRTSDTEKYPQYSFTIENGVTPKTDRYERNFLVTKQHDAFKIVSLGDFVLNPMNLRFGAIGFSRDAKDVAVSSYYNIFEIEDKKFNEFWEYYFKTNSSLNLYDSVATGSLIEKKRVYFSKFIKLKYLIPNNEEKYKITNFLSLIDNRIETQSKIIEDLESQIKWIRYKIFNSQNINNHKLSDYLTEYSEKNISNLYQPVAVGKYGIRKREDIYSKELASDYSKNKVIRKDTLIIGMGSTQIDIGILLDNEIFCVSPAYTTYKIKNINSFYLNEMLIYLNPLLSNKYMIISARQGKSVKKDELLSHKLYIHDIESQNKIERIFVLLYKRLNKEKDILMLYNKQKEYLLKNMFI